MFPAHPQIFSTSSCSGRDLRTSSPHAKVGQAEAEVTRAEVFQNPGVEFKWERWPLQAAMLCARRTVFDTVELLRQRWSTVHDVQHLADLQLERQKRRDIAGLDVDRAVLDAEKYLSNLGQEHGRCGIGSETQRPLAVVIVAGTLSACAPTRLRLPVMSRISERLTER